MTPETKEEKDDDDGSNNNTQDMKQPSSEEEPKLDSNEQGEKEDFVNQGKIPLVLVAHCTVVLCAVACCCSHTHSLSCVGLRRWEALRKGWLSQKSDESTPKAAIPLDVDEIIDLIFSQRWLVQSRTKRCTAYNDNRQTSIYNHYEPNTYFYRRHHSRGTQN